MNAADQVTVPGDARAAVTGRSPVRWPLLAVALLALVMIASACSTGSDLPEGRPFAGDSPWNTPIPKDPVLDPQSEEIVDILIEDGEFAALLDEYGVPIYEADSETPMVEVRCTEDWGTCPVERERVPIPAEAQPSSGSDGALVVIDWSAGRVYDFWQAEQEHDGSWTVSWGTWTAVDGDGIGGIFGGSFGGSTGAGVNLLAGAVRIEELEEGSIEHALAFASRFSCPSVFRYPATKTDGHTDSTPCIPQGARLQLDPSVDVAAIPGITPGELAVARALQVYGGFVRDSAAASLALAFESPQGGAEAYAEVAGFPWDFYDMPHIPWESLRVLDQWDGR